MTKRVNIYIDDTLSAVKEKAGKGNFSPRLSEIIERYNLLLSIEAVPQLTFAEKYILAATANDRKINATILKSLHWAVLDCAEGTQQERAALSEKIEQLSPAARMKLIEGLKYE